MRDFFRGNLTPVLSRWAVRTAATGGNCAQTVETTIDLHRFMGRERV